MLALLSSMVAPEVAGVEDLAHHWRQVLHYYSARYVQALTSPPLTFHQSFSQIFTLLLYNFLLIKINWLNIHLI